MAGIYLICFIFFPIDVFINVRKAYPVGRFLDKQDVDVIKGIATCFVILAHLTIQLGPMRGYNRNLIESYINQTLSIFDIFFKVCLGHGL